MMQNNVYKSNKLSSMPSLTNICQPIVAHFISLQEKPFPSHSHFISSMILLSARGFNFFMINQTMGFPLIHILYPQ